MMKNIAEISSRNLTTLSTDLITLILSIYLHEAWQMNNSLILVEGEKEVLVPALNQDYEKNPTNRKQLFLLLNNKDIMFAYRTAFALLLYV